MNSTDYPLVRCNEFSASVANYIFYIKVNLGSVVIVLSLLAILTIGVTKKYRKDFVYRLLMYFMVVNFFQALCQVLHVIPVEVTSDDLLSIRNGTGWSDVCAVFGFLDMVTSWMGNLVIIWMMLYALKLNSGRIHHRQTVKKCKSHTGDVVGICILFVSPFLFSWIPFVKDMYGVSGPWCWIKMVSEDGCNDSNFQHLSLTFMVTMYYGPLFCILIFVVMCVIATVIRQKCADRTLSFHQTKTRILFTYAFIYCFFCIFPILYRIYTFIHFTSSDHAAYYPLWVVLAVADSSRTLVLALALLFGFWTVLRRIQSRIVFMSSDAVFENAESEEAIAKYGDTNYGQENFPFLHDSPPTQQVGADIQDQPQQVPTLQDLPSGLHNSYAHMEENLPGCISSKGDDKK